MNKIQRLNTLEVYKLAKEFSKNIYSLCEEFPKDYRFEIGSQLRRASYSIGANIAEGYSRSTSKEKLNFFNISKASISECIFFLELCSEMKVTNQEKSGKLLTQLVNLDVKLFNFMQSFR